MGNSEVGCLSRNKEPLWYVFWKLLRSSKVASSAVQVRVETAGCGLHQNDVWAAVETSERLLT